ncbi:MAG TPA: RNA polymerase sigma factor [Rhodanobacteraceae bacterium]
MDKTLHAPVAQPPLAAPDPDAAGTRRPQATRMTRSEFVAVLSDHAAMLGRIAATYEADPSAREDLLQEIALALWQALPRWRGEATLRSFIARVAHNRCVSHIVVQRRHRHEPMLEEVHADPTATAERAATQAERRQRLEAALRHIPLGQRQAVTLAFEGLSHGEIAAALDINVNTVDARLSRARRALTSLLGDTP